MKRHYIVQVRLTRKEYKELREKTEAEKMTMSAFIRMLIQIWETKTIAENVKSI